MPDRYWTGCYTSNGPGGVGSLSVDSRPATWSLEAPVVDPSMLLSSPLVPGVLWAVSEGESAVVGLVIGPSGGVTVRTRVPTAGRLPCHLSITADGTQLLASCYGDGLISAHLLTAEGMPTDGLPLPLPEPAPLGPHPAQQDGPHAHATLETQGLVLAADLGTDRVLRYRRHGRDFSYDGAFVLPPGTGPRDLLLLPTGRVLVLGEHDCRIHVLDLHQGPIASSAIVTDPDPGDQAAGMSLHGGRLTAGLRGSDRIAQLRLDGDDVPHPVRAVSSGGRWPRHHVVDTQRVLVANERSGTITELPWTPQGLIGTAVASVPSPAVTYLLQVDATPPAVRTHPPKRIGPPAEDDAA